MDVRHELATIAPLDIDAEACHAVYERMRLATLTSFARVAASARDLGLVDVADGVECVLGTEPSVVRGPAGYRWLVALVAALDSESEDSLAPVLADFERFRLGALIASGGSGEVELPGTYRDVLIPGTGLSVSLNNTTSVRVLAGEPSCTTHRAPVIGGLLVSSLEPMLANPRSRSQFALAEKDRSNDQRIADLIAETESRFGALFPQFFDRYISQVVPVRETRGIHHAGTDFDAPFAVYLGGGREPGDLMAALAHEESHALVQTMEKLIPGLVPDSSRSMQVPWKPGQTRTLSGIVHGIIAFSRAAAARHRIIESGEGSHELVASRDREVAWVSGVVDDLCRGALGELKGDGVEWLASLVRGIKAGPTGPTTAELGCWSIPEVREVARSPRWVAVDGPSLAACATRLHARAENQPWRRGAPPYARQDVLRLDPADFPELAGPVNAWLSAHAGRELALEALKAHRLRPGDAIPPHEDVGEHAWRVVVGACPDEVGAVPLFLHDERRQRQFGWCPNWGSAVAFRTDEVYHSVPEVPAGSFRYTLIASYR